MKYILLLATVAMTGCASLGKDNLKGAGLGAKGQQAIDKIKDKITPKKQLVVYPLEVCNYEGDVIDCLMVPCEDGAQCSRQFTIEEFLEEHNNFSTLDLTLKQLQSVLEFCEVEPEYCSDVAASYSGQTIVIQEK